MRCYTKFTVLLMLLLALFMTIPNVFSDSHPIPYFDIVEIYQPAENTVFMLGENMGLHYINQFLICS